MIAIPLARWTGLGAVVLVLGCAQVSTDPRQGGLLGGISGLQSGAYEQRIQEREGRLVETQSEQLALADERLSLEQQQRALMREVAQERSRLGRMETDIARMERDVAQLAAQRGANDQRVVALSTRLSSLKNDVTQQRNSLSATASSGVGDPELRRRQLEEQRRNLQREYDLVNTMMLDL